MSSQTHGNRFQLNQNMNKLPYGSMSNHDQNKTIYLVQGITNNYVLMKKKKKPSLFCLP